MIIVTIKVDSAVAEVEVVERNIMEYQSKDRVIQAVRVAVEEATSKVVAAVSA